MIAGSSFVFRSAGCSPQITLPILTADPALAANSDGNSIPYKEDGDIFHEHQSTARCATDRYYQRAIASRLQQCYKRTLSRGVPRTRTIATLLLGRLTPVEASELICAALLGIPHPTLAAECQTEILVAAFLFVSRIRRQQQVPFVEICQRQGHSYQVISNKDG